MQIQNDWVLLRETLALKLCSVPSYQLVQTVPIQIQFCVAETQNRATLRPINVSLVNGYVCLIMIEVVSLVVWWADTHSAIGNIEQIVETNIAYTFQWWNGREWVWVSHKRSNINYELSLLERTFKVEVNIYICQVI